MSTRVPPTPCPWCGYLCDAATPVGDKDAVPKPGDYSVCIECSSINRFDGMLILVRAKEAEWQAAPEPLPTMLRRARRAIIAQPRGWRDPKVNLGRER